jgi:hypothetical protein
MFRALAPIALVAILTACGSTTASLSTPRSSPTASAAIASPSSTATSAPSVVATATTALTLAPQTPAPQTSAPAAAATAAPCVSSAKGTLMTGQALLTDVRVGTHPGYDRVVLEFVSRQAPTNEASTYEIAPATPPYVQDGSGLPMTIRGDRVLGIVLRGATAATLDGRSAYSGSRDFVTQFPALNEFKSRGDFEAVSSWLAGLNQSGCVRTQVLAAPTRLVIDFAHQ